MLTPIHKSTIKAQIRKGQPFKGYIAPCNVNASHIRSGWHIGMSVEFDDITKMEYTISNYAFYNCNSELGRWVRFWKEIPS